ASRRRLRLRWGAGGGVGFGLARFLARRFDGLRRRLRGARRLLNNGVLRRVRLDRGPDDCGFRFLFLGGGSFGRVRVAVIAVGSFVRDDVREDPAARGTRFRAAIPVPLGRIPAAREAVVPIVLLEERGLATAVWTRKARQA